MLWTALQKYSAMFIQFVSGIILARLLTPYDYGCIGMLMIFMVLAEAFIDGGFGEALIQKKQPTQEDYSTIFFWNLGMSVLLYVVLYSSAPAIAGFYDIPLLCEVLRVQGVILFIYAFNVVQRNQLRKNLNFKVLSVVTISTSIVSLIVTVLMAYHGYGVWALVTQNILTALIPSLVFWFYIKWRPMLIFSWQSFRELFSFGFYMFLTHLVNKFSLQIRGLLIGKLYNPVTMGFYSKAYSTEKLASHSISQVLTQVTYPLYANVQDENAKLQSMIKQLSTSIAYLTFPLMFILILVAEPLFVFLYSDRWIDSVPYFQILCLAGLGVCLQGVNLQAISAIGKSRVMFVWSLVKQCLGLILVVAGMKFWGITGLLWGAVLHSWCCIFINMALVSKYIGYKLAQQILDIMPIAVSASIIFAISYIACTWMSIGFYWDGILKFLIYALLYIGWSVVFKPVPYINLKDVVYQLARKGRRKEKVDKN